MSAGVAVRGGSGSPRSPRPFPRVGPARARCGAGANRRVKFNLRGGKVPFSFLLSPLPSSPSHTSLPTHGCLNTPSLVSALQGSWGAPVPPVLGCGVGASAGVRWELVGLCWGELGLGWGSCSPPAARALGTDGETLGSNGKVETSYL